jgi:beta-lactam-binding protein with PASTA domain
VGLDSHSAAKKLQRLGLTLGSISKQYSHQKPGTVLHLSIHVGGKVAEGTRIALVVAKPYPSVPNVVGLTTQQASSKLKEAGYSVRVTKHFSSQPTGTVISISPGSGTELLPGKTVTLTVAKRIPQPSQAPTACTPGYSPCLPIGPSDYDCTGGSGDGPAYTAPGVTYRVTGSDPYGLDSDNDGYGCE